RGDDVEIFRAREDLLERDVGDGVFDDQARAGFAFGDLAPGAAVKLLGAVEVFRDLVSPVAEGAFGKLHDVPLVHQRERLSLVLNGVTDGGMHQSFGGEVADGLEADADLNRHIAMRRPDAFELRLPALRRVFAAETDLLELLGE